MGYHPEEVLFSPTTDCNLICAHCDISQSKKVLSSDRAEKFLIDCKKLGIRKVGFTGGEPFLAFDFLCAIVKRAVKEEMLFDKIMTNGVWYKGKDDLKIKLARLYDAGYDGSICISVDAFHNQDLRKVARFIKTASSIWNRPDIVSIAYTAGVHDDVTKKKLKSLSGFIRKDIFKFIKTFKIDLSPVGRANKLKSPWDDRKWFKEDYCKGPGNIFFVMPDGSVKPCCGYATDSAELTIGNIKYGSAQELIKNARRNRFVSAIFNSGLTKIRKTLQAFGVRFSGKTTSHCYFCYYITTDLPKNLLNKCLGAMKAALIIGLLLFELACVRHAHAETLKISNRYRAIPVRVIEKIKLPKWYHEGLFYDGSNVWVINGKGGKIWVIDISSGTVKSEIEPIASFTEALVKKGDDIFYITDWYEKKIYRARIENNKVIAISSVSVVPSYPAGAIWIDQRLFVIIWTRGFGTKFDLLEMDEKMNMVRKIAVKHIHEPAHLAWDGENLWITSWFSKKIYKVDINEWAITGSFRSPVSRATGIAWDGKYLWLTGTYGNLYKIEIVK